MNSFVVSAIALGLSCTAAQSAQMKWVGSGGLLDNGSYMMMRIVDDGGEAPDKKKFDLMWFDADGLYAEHWDMAQPLAEGVASACYDIKAVIAQNDLVLAFSKVITGDVDTAVVNLMRVRGARIVEHWDAVQAVPADADMPHGNGMFLRAACTLIRKEKRDL